MRPNSATEGEPTIAPLPEVHVEPRILDRASAMNVDIKDDYTIVYNGYSVTFAFNP